MGNLISGTGKGLYGDRWQITCGEHTIKYRLVKSLCFTPKTNITFVSTIIQFLKKKKDDNGEKFWIKRSIQIVKSLVCLSREVVLHYIDNGELSL